MGKIIHSMQGELLALEEKMKVEYGDNWKSHYEKKKNTLPSYTEFVEMQPSAEPAVESINEYRFGEYHSVLKPLLTSTSLFC